MNTKFLLLFLLVGLTISCSATSVRKPGVHPRRDRAWWETSAQRPVRKPTYLGVASTSRYLTMRDGTRLAADIFLPKGLKDGTRIPAIVIQTRYVRSMQYIFPLSIFLRGRFHRTIRYFVRRGYAWVYVDARGSGASFGTRPYPYSPDELADAEEVVDWIGTQPWSNGMVGAWGNSYTGGSALFLAASRHPAVRAVMPRFAMFDMYSEAVFPGGIHLTWLTDTWSRLTEALDKNAIHEFMGNKTKVAVRGCKPVKGDKRREELDAAVLEHGGNRHIDKLVEGITFRDDESRDLPGMTIDQISPHSRLDDLNSSPAVTYLFTGWFDASFILSEIHLFLNLDDPRTKLTIGPWDHGMYNNISPFTGLRKVKFNSNAESVRFFDRWLIGLDNGIDDEARVHYYTLGEERWKSADTWPPPGVEEVSFYLDKDGGLAHLRKSAGADEYHVDYTVGTGTRSRWVSLVNPEHKEIRYKNRKKADEKLLCYTSAPLEAEMEVTGHPLVTLYASSTAEDGNFFVYLEDVGPRGRVEYVTEGMLRALHRKLSDEPPPFRTPVPYRTFLRADASPLVPDEVAELVFALYPTSYLFKKGHSIRVAVAGADKDHFENNPDAPPTVRFHRSARFPSHIDLPVMSKSSLASAAK